MTRKNCKHSTDCNAGSRGPCARCHDMTAFSERMKRLHADPKFAKAASERMKRLNADPEFRAKLAASRCRHLKAGMSAA